MLNTRMSTVLLMVSSSVLAQPYVEYKNEYELKEWDHTKTTHHLRLGYKAKNNLYFEIGPMTKGHSYETGYKFKFDAVTLKGKLETKDTGSAKTKVETEVRFNF
jgi:K+ transporter